MKNTGFTLLEVLIVIVVVAVLVALTIPGFNRTKQAAIDKEVKVSLKLVQAAQKNYRLRTDTYANDITLLGLDLSDVNWTYAIEAATDSTFVAIATDKSGVVWEISQSADEATRR